MRFGNILFSSNKLLGLKSFLVTISNNNPRCAVGSQLIIQTIIWCSFLIFQTCMMMIRKKTQMKYKTEYNLFSIALSYQRF